MGAPLDVSTSATASYLTVGRFLAPNNVGNVATLIELGQSEAAAYDCSQIRYICTALGSTSNRLDFGFTGVATPVISFVGTGNVGIGTTSPAATLDVNGTVAFHGLPTVAPSAGSKQLWADPADSYRVKYAN